MTDITSASRPIRIVVADDDGSFREAAADLIQPQPDLELLAQLGINDEVGSLVRERQPDILLLALDQANNRGFRILETLYSSKLRTRIIGSALVENQDDYVRAVRLGCRGILLKTAHPNLLVKCIRKVHEGELWLDRVTTAQVLSLFTQQLPPEPKARDWDRNSKGTPLSPREREIVSLVTQGYKNKELAEKLLISEQTVKNHMHNIFDKLGVSDRLELALYAIHNHLHDRG